MADPDSELPKTLPWFVRFRRWRQTSATEAQEAENGLLQASKLLGLIKAKDVKVGPGKQDYVHTLEGGQMKKGAPPVVLMPGYGAGSGFFWRNLGGLASVLNIYAVDWLGTGLSGRPPFPAKSQHEAESFFLESMAKWRHQMGMTQKMVLVGHSLGGYLSACYALKHPEHVEHLVLVCPAGVPKEPEDWQKRFLGGASTWQSAAFKTFMWAWEAGFTPQSVVRTLGPYGERLCDGYVSRRFSKDVPPQEAEWFKRYFYQQLAAQGSGEYALRHLLSPGAWAKEPLYMRLRDLKVPVTFIYGRHDWMKPQHAVDLCEELKKERSPKNHSDLHVAIIDNAGHFVFIDQPELFNRALTDACSMYMDRSTEQKAAEVLQAHATEKTGSSTMWEEQGCTHTQKDPQA